jgi:NAD(P)-dependent dehydrogenase (short-subunit alcohol dehydrogenase family)
VGKLEGKVAFITGASRGIGAGIARAFALEGGRLSLVARNADALRKLADELGAVALAVACDVTDEAQVADAFRQTVEHFGGLDVVINNAGAFDGGPIEALSVEAWEHVMAVNLRGPFLCTREAFRVMKPRGGGRIINVGSISAQRVRLHSAPYSTSKHGLWGLTQAAALEGREFGISCGCVHPGNTQVERRTGDDEPMMRVEDLAQTIVTMAALPPNVNMLEVIVLPVEQLYIGRG